MGSSRVTPPRSKSVVITGASSGLGKAAAIHLTELGYRVFAGVRTESSAAGMRSGGHDAPSWKQRLSAQLQSRSALLPLLRACGKRSSTSVLASVTSRHRF